MHSTAQHGTVSCPGCGGCSRRSGRSLDSFRSGWQHLPVAADVAARGMCLSSFEKAVIFAAPVLCRALLCLQFTRMKVLDSFRSGQQHLLVATDVAARGLDIKSIKTVINYDAARDIDTHIHRY